MSSGTTRDSLSATNDISTPTRLTAYTGLSHPPSKQTTCTVKPLSIKVGDGPDGAVAGFLHLPSSSKPDRAEEAKDDNDNVAAVLLSGAGGGVVGPSSIYISMADKLASLKKPVPCLRLDFRYPARNRYCVPDVQAAMSLLEDEYSLKRFILVGWSFGGAPVFTIGGMDQRVIGCATVASQTAETEGIRQLSPRPVLLLHGTRDRTLSYSCSERLFAMYGSTGDRQIRLFDEDDHALTRNSLEAERTISEFILRCAGVELDSEEEDLMKEKLVGDGEKVELMKRGGDLRGSENVE